MADLFTVVATLAGTVFFLAGSIGLLRFPDLCSRLHALTKADNLGLGLIALGVLAQAGSLAFAAKVILAWFVTLAASAVVGHLIARDALGNSPGASGVNDDRMVR
ncbi:MAG: monovalent cation/H(+) antiporter subunit G [Halieaceae bacterium]|jgi:multicomponent Na+:H+ antiporter subunit G|nr:monovalent cation/H(+) antiporter subunit G [Halieaceae bacterium]